MYFFHGTRALASLFQSRRWIYLAFSRGSSRLYLLPSFSKKKKKQRDTHSGDNLWETPQTERNLVPCVFCFTVIISRIENLALNYGWKTLKSQPPWPASGLDPRFLVGACEKRLQTSGPLLSRNIFLWRRAACFEACGNSIKSFQSQSKGEVHWLP